MRIAAMIKEIPGMLREILLEPALRKAALLILPYAGVIVGLDVAARYGEVTGAHLPTQFFMSQDLGFGEYLEYSMLLSVAVLLFLMWLRDRSPIYLVNAVLFVYLAADDALEFHEKFGFWVAPALARILPTGLPIDAHYLGEPLLFAMVGVIWVAGLALSLRQSRLRPVIFSMIMVGCIGVTAFFGIFVDALTDYGPHTVARTNIEAFIEDGGEFAMIVLSFMLTVAIFEIEKRRAGEVRHDQA